MTARKPQMELASEQNSDEIDTNPGMFVRDWESFVAVYDGLRSAARRRMRSMGDHLSLGPTGLVHEVFPRLERDPKFDPKSDRNFMFASALRAMRVILIDRARARRSISMVARCTGSCSTNCSWASTT